MFGAPRAMIKTIQDKMLKSNVNVIARARSMASIGFRFRESFAMPSVNRADFLRVVAKCADGSAVFTLSP